VSLNKETSSKHQAVSFFTYYFKFLSHFETSFRRSFPYWQIFSRRALSSAAIVDFASITTIGYLAYG
jgi:hypothetical protein